MLTWAPLLLAVVMVFFLERPGEKESRIVSGIVYLVLGAFNLNVFAYYLPLGIPVAIMLMVRKIDNKPLKIISALVGAVAGWVYYTWFRVPG